MVSTLKQYNDLYKKAYEILGDLTPLESDCGKLCSAACCKGDENTGMRLFPHEESALKVIECDGFRLSVCNGSCERDLRPLSCRIFPFFPVLHKNGRITAEIDARALRLCPIAENCDKVRFNKDFITAVRKVGRLLSQDPECRKFIADTSAEINSYKKLLGFNKRYSKRR